MANQAEIDAAFAVIKRLETIFGTRKSAEGMYWKFQGRKSFGQRMPVETFVEVLDAIPVDVDLDRQRKFYVANMMDAWKRFQIEQDGKNIRNTYDKLRRPCEEKQNQTQTKQSLSKS